MENEGLKNANRFIGFADTYEEARPHMPLYPTHIIEKYLGKKPDVVVDIGCGTGLSTEIWKDHCETVIGVEPSDDMLSVARKKENDTISFVKAFSHATGLDDCIADAAVCSQSFHWMEPVQTLSEINRILKPNGIFATVDCDWPPIYNWVAEQAYQNLFDEVQQIEEKYPALKSSYKRWSKDHHLDNIQKSQLFRYAREIVFANTEKCDKNRIIKLVFSQGGLQNIIKTKPELITPHIERFKQTIMASLSEEEFEIDFSYRMRIGIK